MRLKFRAIKNRLCRARNKNIRNIGKNNGLFNADGKGRMGTKEELRPTIRVPIDLITRGTRDTGGTSQLFSPAQSKQKGIHPLRVRVPETGKEFG